MNLLEFAQPDRPRRLLPIAAGRLGVAPRVACAAGVVALLLAGALLVYSTGGTRLAWPHVMYVPILLAGWGFGPLGGVLAAIAAGLLVGPMMPVDTATGEPQETANWLYRLCLFTLIGGVGGGLDQLLRTQLVEADRSRRRFTSLVHHAPDLILVCGADLVVRYASPSTATLLGVADDDLVGRTLVGLVHGADRIALAALTNQEGHTQAPEELRVRHRDGSWRHLEVTASNLLADPDVGAIVLNARDVTQRRAVEAELLHQAMHDAATGLPNRRQLMEQVRDALHHEHAAGGRRAVLMLMNLDRFRAINEAYGPEVGDQLIVALAQRLAAETRPQDVLARYSGNEFALLCPNLAVPNVGLMAQQLLDSVREPFLLITGEVRLSASVGVVRLGDEGQDPAGLIGDAYAAVQRAKGAGGNRWALFHPGWRERAGAALRTEHALHGALERDELELHYQPIVALDSNRLVSVEALLRWHHPQLGLVPPNDFVPIAEQTGSIVPIGRWVLREACRQLAGWRRHTDPCLSVAVNLSALQLDDPALVEHVREALELSGIPPAALTLELTESVLLRDAERTAQTLSTLKQLGVRIAVDDFGTGYSSLGHLHELPVDVLKIDRLFIRRLGSDDAILSAVVGLARTLRLDTVAEGVETPQQARTLTRLGCDRAQGFLYARPEPPARITPLLNNPLPQTAALARTRRAG